MSLNIGDQVKIIIVEKRLCGLHIVKIINHEQYSAILIPTRKENCKWFKICFEGLTLRAQVIRINKNQVDLLEEN